jgi:Flp pilus assembly protein TadG
MTRRMLPRLRGDRRGVTVVEFGLIAPVMLMLIMGLGDLLYQMYMQSILTGAVQKAGRDSGIEGGSTTSATIDNKVKAMVLKIAPNATFSSTRKSYDNFTEVAPEPFTDTNHNGVRDSGECFTDVNANGVWDSDPGSTGQGGADAVAIYTMTVTYPRLFPIAKLVGWSNNQTVSAMTLLKNQPYANQVTTTSVTVCT